jgi:hypothetical protein
MKATNRCMCNIRFFNKGILHRPMKCTVGLRCVGMNGKNRRIRGEMLADKNHIIL